ncbi:endonuclease MutS2 [Brevibacillus sp. SYSU BS000544]|uniref:endonuclease MutS2 n=1 Tax=Brevibacillus sp. SYSU BS000544 TaxID=3416443 RepID=UPI003CE46D07
MNQNAISTLEFDLVKEKLMNFAISEQGKEKVRKLQPYTDLVVIENALHETTEARAIVDKGGSVPLHGLHDIEQVMEKLGKGASLHPDQLMVVQGLLETGKKLKKYMNDKKTLAPQVSSYACSIYDLDDLSKEILRCIRFGKVDDQASKELSKARKKIRMIEDRIKMKLDSILKSSAYRDYIQDGVVSMRDGRYVIPIKKEHRRHIEGNILDSSASGQTVFIEPVEVKKLQNELHLFKAEEEVEEEKILIYLTSMVEEYKQEISINIETMAHYDFLFAKAKLSRSFQGRAVTLNRHNTIRIKGAKHPLIGESAVPLDVTIGKSYTALVITGPNTGGKTVAIKTVGLLAIMVQAGLHVPVQEDSEFPVFQDILVDIGDGQSIDQSLSTFSAHIRNIISILERARPQTLVIVDELGTGTDPMEGMGLAISILEELNRRGATILATTHYSEIKEFAEKEAAFENGSMEFDLETLRPLYRLRIGKAGKSQAFPIALRLGMARALIERAHEITYKETKVYDKSSFEAPVKDYDNRPTQQEKREKEEELSKKQSQKPREPVSEAEYSIGDRVYISSIKTYGIICELENHKGELGVMVGQKKLKINKKRLALQIKSKKLYPDNYDMAIVFDSKETRKKERIMKKRHVEGLTIDRTEE